MWSVIMSNYFLKALLEDKQKQEEIEKMKETVSQIVQDAAVRTKKVVRSFNLNSEFYRISQLKTRDYLSVCLMDLGK